MRIVSQNKTMSFNFDQIELWFQSNMLYARHGNDSKVLGQYETEERAAEVFQDIHNAYAPVTIICQEMSEDQVHKLIGSKNINATCIQTGNVDQSITTYDDRVYYMPEE